MTSGYTVNLERGSDRTESNRTLKNIEKLKKIEFVLTKLFRTNSIEFESVRFDVRYKFASFTVSTGDNHQ